MPKFEQAVTAIPAEWANTVDALVYGVFRGASSVEDIRKVLGLGSLAFVSSISPALQKPVLNQVAINGGTAAFDAATSRLPVRDNDVATKVYVDDATKAIRTLITKQVKATGDMAHQNANNIMVTGGVLDAVTLGAKYPCTGIFTSLHVTTMPTRNNHVVNLAYFNERMVEVSSKIGTLAAQNANKVAITGGSIEGTTIGKMVPADAVFNRVKVVRQPLEGTDCISKAYFEDVLNKSVNAVKTMALQDSNSVSITGGALNNTTIGLAQPVAAAFSSLTVKSADDKTPVAAIRSVKVLPTAASMVFVDPDAVDIPLASINVLGQQDQQYPLGLVISGNAAVAVQNSKGYGVAALDNKLVLFSSAAQMLTVAGQKMLLGGGSFSDKATITINAKTYIAEAEMKRMTQVNSLLYMVDTSASAGILTSTTELATTSAGGAVVKLDKDTVFAFRNSPEDSGMLRVFRVIVNVQATNLNVSWPTTLKWAGTPPNYNTAAVNTVDMLEFTTVDGGNNWYGVKLN